MTLEELKEMIKRGDGRFKHNHNGRELAGG